jgi:hypothetical protein
VDKSLPTFHMLHISTLNSRTKLRNVNKFRGS